MVRQGSWPINCSKLGVVCYNEHMRFFVDRAMICLHRYFSFMTSMRPFRICLTASFCIAAHALSWPAFAQQENSASRQAPPPPRLEKLEEGEAPAVTIRPAPDKSTITEKRAPGGKRTEVKVTTGKSTYYVKPADEAGTALPGDAQSIAAKPALWEVMTFDLTRQKQIQQEPDEQAVLAPAPPAATKSTNPTSPPAKK